MKRKRTTKQEASVILQDTEPEQSFWVNNGPVIRSLPELAVALRSMSDDQYKHHVNHYKNDFSNWLQDVVRDEVLSKDIVRARDKNSAAKKVEKRVELLKQMID